METDENQTPQSFRACKKILENLFSEYGGRIFNTAGDSILAEFSSAVSAVICASEFQKLILERNISQSLPSMEKWNFVLVLIWVMLLSKGKIYMEME